jgi:hypothetical protein
MLKPLVASVLFLSLGLVSGSSARAQEFPREVLAAALKHIADKAGGPVLVAIDRFPNPEVARGAGSSLGFRVAPRAEIVQCSEERRACQIIGNEKRVVSFSAFAVIEGGVALRLLISTPVRRPDGTSELRASIREFSLSLVNGRWTVTGDKALVIS